MDAKELKPCPFCGSKTQTSWADGGRQVAIRCQNCQSGTRYWREYDAAVLSWNARAAAPQAVAAVLADARAYLQCVVDGSMSRNNAESLAMELIGSIDALAAQATRKS